MLLFQSKDQFYKQRALDKRPLLLPPSRSATENIAANDDKAAPALKIVKGGPKP